MFTMNQLNNEITLTKRTIQRAQAELNAGRDHMPEWKIESLEELIEDGLEYIDAMREHRRKANEAWHLERGDCPSCQKISDMPGSYCSACQQTAAEIKYNVQ